MAAVRFGVEIQEVQTPLVTIRTRIHRITEAVIQAVRTTAAPMAVGTAEVLTEVVSMEAEDIIDMVCKNRQPGQSLECRPATQLDGSGKLQRDCCSRSVSRAAVAGRKVSYASCI